ncbi:hypothetical protein B0H19DRAFT_1071224 [Mycena capillaripes]|nr:hypothetical protein B0H19DRAFT_1071224 [Mycena capillaripes]
MKLNLTLTRGPARLEEKLSADCGWRYRPHQTTSYVARGIAKNPGGIPGAAGHILSHETSAASSAIAHRQQSERERTSTGTPKIESKSERSAAGLGPRQRRVKVRGADRKMLNINAMEYKTRNITHLQREPARGGEDGLGGVLGVKVSLPCEQSLR